MIEAPRAPAADGFGRGPRLRLLPALIVVAAVILTLRVVDMWQGVEVLAQEATRDEAALQEPAVDPAGAGGVEGQASEAGQPAQPLGLDPLRMTETEIQLLQELSARREQLEARERSLAEREALLAAAEGRIDEKVLRLESLQATIEGLLVEFDEQEEEQFGSLVRIYENMKPRDAARIFEQLDMTVLLEVIGRMRERNSAPILAQMRPDRAQQVTLQLAQRRELPIER